MPKYKKQNIIISKEIEHEEIQPYEKPIRKERSMVSEDNPMYGKKHSEEAKKIIRKKKKQERNDPNFVDKRKGISLYDIWVEKYGVEVADEKRQERIELIQDKNSGVNHPMYGKVGGRSTGSGWKGTYKGRYFRSVKELSFLVNYVEQFKLNAILIGKEDGIEYIDKYGNVRIYYADYVINDRYMIEIVPNVKYYTTRTDVVNRRKSAEEYCLKKGWEYKEVIPIKISYSQISMYLKEFKLKFDEVTMKKYEAYLVKGVHRDIDSK